MENLSHYGVTDLKVNTEVEKHKDVSPPPFHKAAAKGTTAL